MLLFRDEEHATNWRTQHQVTEAGRMSLDTGWRLARTWYTDKRGPNWRRSSLEDAEALFARLGLTGDFWRLRS
jgi:hypothetical protein